MLDIHGKSCYDIDVVETIGKQRIHSHLSAIGRLGFI